MQFRQSFARAKPFRPKKANFFLAFFVFQKSQRGSKEIWLQKSRIGNPNQQFSVFIFAYTYTGLLYYVLIRFWCRAQSIIAKFAHIAQIQVANLTGRLLYIKNLVLYWL